MRSRQKMAASEQGGQGSAGLRGSARDNLHHRTQPQHVTNDLTAGLTATCTLSSDCRLHQRRLATLAWANIVAEHAIDRDTPICSPLPLRTAPCTNLTTPCCACVHDELHGRRVAQMPAVAS